MAAAATEVLTPTSEEEAIAAFGDGTDVVVVGGGTIVVPDLTYRRLEPKTALMLGGSGLSGVGTDGSRVAIGATTPVQELVGMAAPLFALAALWDRCALGQRRWLRGGGIRLGNVSLHSTNLVAGGLFILLGATFIASQGGSLLSGTYDDLGLSALGFRLQEWVANSL
jgi:hypothetical protein